MKKSKYKLGDTILLRKEYVLQIMRDGSRTNEIMAKAAKTFYLLNIKAIIAPDDTGKTMYELQTQDGSVFGKYTAWELNEVSYFYDKKQSYKYNVRLYETHLMEIKEDTHITPGDIIVLKPSFIKAVLSENYGKGIFTDIVEKYKSEYGLLVTDSIGTYVEIHDFNRDKIGLSKIAYLVTGAIQKYEHKTKEITCDTLLNRGDILRFKTNGNTVIIKDIHYNRLLAHERSYAIENSGIIYTTTYLSKETELVLPCNDNILIDNNKEEKQKEYRAAKDTKGKTRFSLLPLRALEPVTRVLNFGATTKYAVDNWKWVENKASYVDAIMRHWQKYIEGEENDAESKESHLACIVCNALFLIWDRQQHKDIPFKDYIEQLTHYDDYKDKNEFEDV